MQASDIPSKFPIPWANSAGSGYTRAVPEASQIGITNGAASLTDGFPPLTFLPTASGGVPPFGQDTNGILKQITQWLRWAEAGAPVAWDSVFSAAIGGYPNGAIVASATTPQLWWLSTADNNTTNPDSGGAGWTVWQVGVASRTGSLVTSTTLTAANSGTYFNVGDGTQTLPAPSATTGLVFGFYASGAFTLSTPSGQFFGGGIAAGAVSLSPADWIHIQSDGSNWRIIGCAPGLVGSAAHQFAVAAATATGNAVNLGQFPSSLAVPGWKKYPDSSSPTGYIIDQWGTGSCPATSSTSSSTDITFPVPFPNVLLDAGGNATGTGNSTQGGWPAFCVETPTTTGFTAVVDVLGYTTINQSVPFRWRAKGY